MRDEIRKTLQYYQNLFGEDAFFSPALFAKKALDTLPDAAIEPAHMLIITAIGSMDAYSRMVNSTSRNRVTDVENLTREMHKRYHINAATAKLVIESIAELLGYTPEAEDFADTPPAFLSATVGDTLTFGDYLWRVLDSQEDKLLLISQDILEQRAYHPCYEQVTWENSTLRGYLNNDFLRQFTHEESSKIIETTIANPDNLWYGTPGGNDTLDKIFVLNLEEVDRYFGDSGDYLNMRRKKYDKGRWVADDKGWIFANMHDKNRIAKHKGADSLWWLRTPGYSDCTVAYVSTTGNIPLNGDRVCIFRGGVRPAFWISAEVRR